MKQAITIRLDPELLAAARAKAKEENRTLTNFLETALKDRFSSGTSRQSDGIQKSVRKRNPGRSFNAK
jgi:predicted transcriptional regulator